MANQIDVVVLYDPKANPPTLTIGSPVTTIGDGDWVCWDFQGLTPDVLPRIIFPDTTQQLGPFSSVRMQPPSSVWGKGNTGVGGGALFGYEALVLDQVGGQKAFAIATIVNNATKPDSTPAVTVLFTPSTPSQPAALSMDPLLLILNPGDTAAWIFPNPPPNTHAVITFQMTVGGWSLLGPFVSINVSPFQAGFVVSAMDYQPPGIVGEVIKYTVELWHDDDKLAAINDPGIENLGPPPGPIDVDHPG